MIAPLPTELWTAILEYARPTPLELKGLTLLTGPSSNRKPASALTSLAKAAEDDRLIRPYVLAQDQILNGARGGERELRLQTMALQPPKELTSTWAEFDRRMQLKPLQVRQRIVQAYKQPSDLRYLQEHEFEWVRDDPDLSIAYGYAYQQTSRELPPKFFPTLLTDKETILRVISEGPEEEWFAPSQFFQELFPTHLARVKSCGPLSLASQALKKDVFVIQKAIERHPAALFVLSSDLLMDRDVTMAADAAPETSAILYFLQEELVQEELMQNSELTMWGSELDL